MGYSTVLLRSADLYFVEHVPHVLIQWMDDVVRIAEIATSRERAAAPVLARYALWARLGLTMAVGGHLKRIVWSRGRGYQISGTGDLLVCVAFVRWFKFLEREARYETRRNRCPAGSSRDPLR